MQRVHGLKRLIVSSGCGTGLPWKKRGVFRVIDYMNADVCRRVVRFCSCPSLRMSRLTTSRQPAFAPSPQAKPAITAEEWDAKAPLTDGLAQSIRNIRSVCETRAIP